MTGQHSVARYARRLAPLNATVGCRMMMKKPTDKELHGMTVNERIYAIGLLDQWDRAAKARDRDRMIQILSQCALSQEQCVQTTDAVLKNPAMYGF